MNIVLKGAAVVAVVAFATPCFAQVSEELNRVELCRIAVAQAPAGTTVPGYPCAYPYAWAYPGWYGYPYMYPYATPTAYPGPNPAWPFAPAEIIKGNGGTWHWENHAYQWHPDKT